MKASTYDLIKFAASGAETYDEWMVKEAEMEKQAIAVSTVLGIIAVASLIAGAGTAVYKGRTQASTPAPAPEPEPPDDFQLPEIPAPGSNNQIPVHPDNADRQTGNPEWDALSRDQQDYYQRKYEEGPETWGVRKSQRNEIPDWKPPHTIAPRLLPDNAKLDENTLDYVAPSNKPVWKLDDEDTMEFNSKYTQYDPATGKYQSPQTVFNKMYRETEAQRAKDLKDHGDPDYKVKKRQDMMYGKGGLLSPMATP